MLVCSAPRAVTTRCRLHRVTLSLASLFLSGLMLVGCKPAVSLRPLYDAKDKPVTEAQIEGDWVSPDSDKIGSKDKDKVAVRWNISNQKDHYWVRMHSSKSDNGEDKPEDKVYAASLVELENNLFVDLEWIESKTAEHTIYAKDLETGTLIGHLVGRVWLHPDYLRVALLDSQWLQDHGHDDFRQILGSSSSEIANSTAVITASNADMRKFLAQNAENDDAFALRFYLCRPSKDCELLALTDELTHTPDDPDLVQDASRFFLARGDYGKALALARHRVLLQPQVAAAGKDVGVALLYQRDFSGARREFASAQKLAQDDLELAADIGWSYFLEGNYQEAARAFSECSKNAKNNSADPILGEYFSLLRLNRRADAEETLARNAATFHGATMEQILLLEAQGRTWDGVIAASGDEQRGRFAFFQGLAWLAKGNRQDASGSLNTALEKVDPSSVLSLVAQTELRRLQPNQKSGGKTGGRRQKSGLFRDSAQLFSAAPTSAQARSATL